MKIDYPHTISNCLGEKIVFKSITNDPDQDKVLLEAYLEPGSGPVMHTHFMQDESLTVVYGEMMYQTLGNEPKPLKTGETILFKRGTPHKFWNSGDGLLKCEGWISPVYSVVYFLTALYHAQNVSGQSRPEPFDGAYLLTKYAKEYDLPEVPALVKNVVMPLIYFTGNLLKKYPHFKDAPKPLT